MKFNKYEFPKTDTFFKIVFASLLEWQKFIIEQIHSSEEEDILVKTMRKKYKDETGDTRFPANTSKIQDFITNYRHGHKELELGDVFKEDTNLFIRVNPELQKLENIWDPSL